MEPDGIHASDTLLNFDSVSHLQLTSNDGFRFGRYGKVFVDLQNLDLPEEFSVEPEEDALQRAQNILRTSTASKGLKSRSLTRIPGTRSQSGKIPRFTANRDIIEARKLIERSRNSAFNHFQKRKKNEVEREYLNSGGDHQTCRERTKDGGLSQSTASNADLAGVYVFHQSSTPEGSLRSSTVDSTTTPPPQQIAETDIFKSAEVKKEEETTEEPFADSRELRHGETFPGEHGSLPFGFGALAPSPPRKSALDESLPFGGYGGDKRERIHITDSLDLDASIDGDTEEEETTERELPFCQSSAAATSSCLPPPLPTAVSLHVESHSALPVADTPLHRSPSPLNSSGNLSDRSSPLDEPKREERFLRREHQREFNAEFMECMDQIRNLRPNTKPGYRLRLYTRLARVCADFLHAARMYARIIVSELHLPNHKKTVKEIRALNRHHGRGMAGGVRFQARDILFKLAVNHSLLYGTDEWSDARAAKAAALELRAFTHLHNCYLATPANEEGIFFPLACTVDFCGNRILCCSKLDIVPYASLSYGSDDGGRSLKMPEDRKTLTYINGRLRMIANRLNLRQHWVCPSADSQCHKIWTPIDMEIHCIEKNVEDHREDSADYHSAPSLSSRRRIVDVDSWIAPQVQSARALHSEQTKQLFAVDVHRLFPPEFNGDAFAPEEGASALYRQLRPELVMRYKIPLSSDAQSKFSSLSSSRSPSPNTVSIDDAKVDAPSADHVRAIKEIRGATAQMFGDIKRMATRLKERHTSYTKNVCVHMHQRGINLRFLGILYRELGWFDTVSANYWRAKCLIEMVCRSIKDELNLCLRETLRNTGDPGQFVCACEDRLQITIYRDLVIDYLNLVFGSSLQSQQYWNDGLQKSVDKKFSSSYPLWIRERMTQSSRQNGPHVDDISDLTFHETFMECTKNCSPLLRDPRCELLKRILKLLNLRLHEHTYRDMVNSPRAFSLRRPFQDTDLRELRERAKFTSTGFHCNGAALRMRCFLNPEMSPIEYRRMMDLASKFFKKALKADPTNKVSLRNLGDCMMLLSEHLRQHLESHSRPSSPAAARSSHEWSDTAEGHRSVGTNTSNSSFHLSVGGVNAATCMCPVSIELSSAFNAVPNHTSLSTGQSHSHLLSLSGSSVNHTPCLEKIEDLKRKAEELYTLALERDPKDTYSLYKMALFQDTVGEHAEAEKKLKSLVKIDSTHSNAYCAYADFLVDIPGKERKAEEYYRRSFQVDPMNHSSYNNLACLLTRRAVRLLQGERSEQVLDAAFRDLQEAEGLLTTCIAIEVEHPSLEVHLRNLHAFWKMICGVDDSDEAFKELLTCAKELSLCGVGGLAYADWLEGDTSPYDSRDDAAERN